MSPSNSPAQRRRKKRMSQAVEFRAQGFSLRAIANHLGVDHVTVMRDLRRWEKEQEMVHFRGANAPESGANAPSECTTQTNVIPLQRKNDASAA
jgi:IS30 family transposase